MTTHERELTEPVDLTTPDGTALNPDAVGWSRRPLHRTSLYGLSGGAGAGRNKQWDYWAVLAGDLLVSVCYADIDYFAFCDVWWTEISTGRSGRGAVGGRREEFVFPEIVGARPLVAHGDGFSATFVDDADGTTITVRWDDDGVPCALDVHIALPPGHESCNVVIAWSDHEFNFTSKQQARPASGALQVGDTCFLIGGDDAWGVLDVGRGRWPAEIVWNWGGGAGRTDGHVVGLQFGARWTEGTGHTENAMVVDGRVHKIGRELEWTYDWDAPMEPWRVRDPGGQLDVTLRTTYDKYTVLGDESEGRATHQVFGRWHGWLVTDDGLRIELRGIQGFAEEARQRW